MAPQSLGLIRMANQKFRDFFKQVSPGPAGSVEGTVDLAQFQELAGVIIQVGQSLATESSPDPPDQQIDAKSRPEVVEYTENLQRLKPVAEKLQSSLAEHQDSIQAGVARLQAALAWAASFKLTR